MMITLMSMMPLDADIYLRALMFRYCHYCRHAAITLIALLRFFALTLRHCHSHITMLRCRYAVFYDAAAAADFAATPLIFTYFFAAMLLLPTSSPR